MQMGARELEHGNRRAARGWILITIGLGSVFLLNQYLEWRGLSFSVSTDAYGSLFYLMTGFHGLHVLLGLICMVGLLIRIHGVGPDPGDRYAVRPSPTTGTSSTSCGSPCSPPSTSSSSDVRSTHSVPAILTALAVALTTAGLLATAPATAQTTTAGYSARRADRAAAAPVASAPARRPGAAGRGEQLYTQACTSCHGPDGEGMELSGGVQAPSLVGVGAAAVDFYLSTGRMPLADTNVPQAVRKPPAFDADQRAAIVAYVVSFGPGGPPIPQVNPATANLPRGLELYLLQLRRLPQRHRHRRRPQLRRLRPRPAPGHPPPRSPRPSASAPATCPSSAPTPSPTTQVNDIVRLRRVPEASRGRRRRRPGPGRAHHRGLRRADVRARAPAPVRRLGGDAGVSDDRPDIGTGADDGATEPVTGAVHDGHMDPSSRNPARPSGPSPPRSSWPPSPGWAWPSPTPSAARPRSRASCCSSASAASASGSPCGAGTSCPRARSSRSGRT